jgi:hypothetical protein
MRWFALLCGLDLPGHGRDRGARSEFQERRELRSDHRVGAPCKICQPPGFTKALREALQ